MEAPKQEAATSKSKKGKNPQRSRLQAASHKWLLALQRLRDKTLVACSLRSARQSMPQDKGHKPTHKPNLGVQGACIRLLEPSLRSRSGVRSPLFLAALPLGVRLFLNFKSATTPTYSLYVSLNPSYFLSYPLPLESLLLLWLARGESHAEV